MVEDKYDQLNRIEMIINYENEILEKKLLTTNSIETSLIELQLKKNQTDKKLFLEAVVTNCPYTLIQDKYRINGKI